MKEENAHKEISIETNSNTENSVPENERKGWMTTRTERADYGQYKTGSDAKGITFAIQTFSAKFTSSISTSLGMWVVGVFGFISYSANSFAELKEMGATQTPEVLRGLWLAYALIPVIGGILQMILLLFYKLNDKDVQIMSDYNSGVINREQAEASLSRKY